jgi:hypothetical protein
LIEWSVELVIEKAYVNLKTLLLQKGCTIISEEPSKFISLTQGSIWGSSPRSAKKIINCSLSATGLRTRITVSSTLSSDWKNLTTIGSVLSVVVAAVSWWISADLEDFLARRQPSWWSWIVTSKDFTNVAVALSVISLTRILAVFLAVGILLEIFIYVYAKRRIDVFAEENLERLV